MSSSSSRIKKGGVLLNINTRAQIDVISVPCPDKVIYIRFMAEDSDEKEDLISRLFLEIKENNVPIREFKPRRENDDFEATQNSRETIKGTSGKHPPALHTRLLVTLSVYCYVRSEGLEQGTICLQLIYGMNEIDINYISDLISNHQYIRLKLAATYVVVEREVDLVENERKLRISKERFMILGTGAMFFTIAVLWIEAFIAYREMCNEFNKTRAKKENHKKRRYGGVKKKNHKKSWWKCLGEILLDVEHRL